MVGCGAVSVGETDEEKVHFPTAAAVAAFVSNGDEKDGRKGCGATQYMSTGCRRRQRAGYVEYLTAMSLKQFALACLFRRRGSELKKKAVIDLLDHPIFMRCSANAAAPPPPISGVAYF